MWSEARACVLGKCRSRLNSQPSEIMPAPIVGNGLKRNSGTRNLLTSNGITQSLIHPKSALLSPQELPPAG